MSLAISSFHIPAVQGKNKNKVVQLKPDVCIRFSSCWCQLGAIVAVLRMGPNFYRVGMKKCVYECTSLVLIKRIHHRTRSNKCANKPKKWKTPHNVRSNFSQHTNPPAHTHSIKPRHRTTGSLQRDRGPLRGPIRPTAGLNMQQTPTKGRLVSFGSTPSTASATH